MAIQVNVKVDKEELDAFKKATHETNAGLRETLRDLMDDALAFMKRRARANYRARVTDPKGSQVDTIVGSTIKKVAVTGRGSRSDIDATVGIGTTAKGKRIKDFWAQEFGADIKPVKKKVLAVPVAEEAWFYRNAWQANKFYNRSFWKNFFLYGANGRFDVRKLFWGSFFEQVAGGKGKGQKFMRDARDEAAEQLQKQVDTFLARSSGWNKFER